MRKILKKAALTLVFSLAVAAVAPAAQESLAASNAKTFTYAEQISGRKVTELQMSIGEKEDIRFIGVPDYGSYTWGWTSSNESVAVVDRGGVITAIGEGVTCIRLIVGDESKYTSDGVIVYVGSQEEIVLGTSANNTFTAKKMERKGTLDLNYYGFTGDSSKYFCKWTSSDPTVASVTKEGVVLAKREGLTVIQMSLINLYKDEVLNAVPVAIQVAAPATPTPKPTATPTPKPTATPTPKPTAKPTATATPKPTATATPKPTATATPKPTATATPKPTATATPTATPKPTTTVTPKPTTTVTPKPTALPTATPAVADYKITVESDKVLLLSFNTPVDYERDDIDLYTVKSIVNYTPVDVKYSEIKKVELNDDGTELRIYSNEVFTNDTYKIKVNGEEQGTTFQVNIGEPNKIVVTYECLGRTGQAYACITEDDYLDIPINLSYQIYYNNIKLTDFNSDNSMVEYSILSADNKENIDIQGDCIYFNEPGSGYFQATYSYWTSEGEKKEVTNRFKIEAKNIGTYKIEQYPIVWTIVDKDFEGPIDWENPVHSIIASDVGKQFVALITDNYGFKYATSECGVDEQNEIYSITDATQLFAKKGYSIRFKTEQDDFVVLDDGEIFTYQQVVKPIALLDLVYVDSYGNEKSTTLYPLELTIRPERKINKLETSESSVTLSTNALDGYIDKFCKKEITINMFDQYGDPWTGEYNFALSTTNSSISGILDSSDMAYIKGNVLYLDAKLIKEYVNKATKTVTFTITETISGKSKNVTVTLQTPATVSSTDKTIKVDGWNVAANNAAIAFDPEDTTNLWSTKKAVIELFQLSNNVKVGLEDTEKIILLDTSTPSTTKADYTTADIGNYYVAITGPDGKLVTQAENGTGLGVYLDENSIKLNLTAPVDGGTTLEFIKSGAYTVKVWKLTNITEQRVVFSAYKSANFAVTDETTKEIVYKDRRSSKTTLAGDDLYSVKQIVEELLIFTMDGSTWSGLDAEMIVDVNYTPIGDGAYPNYVFIRSVKFAVPVDGKTLDIPSYYQEVKEINASIRVGVDEY